MYNNFITMFKLSSPTALHVRLAICLSLLCSLTGCARPAPSIDLTNTLDLRTTHTHTAGATSSAALTLTPSPTATATRTARPTRTPTSAPTRTPTATPPGTLTPTLPQKPSGPFKAIVRLQEITPGLVTAITVLPDGKEILLAGTFGMTRIDTATLKASTARYWGRSLGLDQSGVAWALPPDGATIAAWQDNAWREYGRYQGWVLPASLPETPLSSSRIVSGAAGTVWLATASDVRRFDGRQWSIYPATSSGIDLPYKAGIESALTVAASASTGEAWAGSCNWREGEIVGGGGLRYFDGRRWDDSGFPRRLACILSLQIAPDGMLWASSASDLWRYDPSTQEWQQFSAPPLRGSQRYSYILDFVINPRSQPCPLLSIEDAGGRPLQRVRFCIEGHTWQVVRTLPALALQELRFLPDGSLLSFEEGIILHLQPDGVWQPLVEMDYAAFHVGPGAEIWLVNQVETRPLVWQADLADSE